jgi:hypothetical protein
MQRSRINAARAAHVRATEQCAVLGKNAMEVHVSATHRVAQMAAAMEMCAFPLEGRRPPRRVEAAAARVECVEHSMPTDVIQAIARAGVAVALPLTNVEKMETPASHARPD